MNKILSILLLFHFFNLRSFSQEKLVTCSSERNQDKSYTIYAESRGFANYTVKLSFSMITGYEIAGYNTTLNPGYYKTIGTGRTQVAKLTLMGDNARGTLRGSTFNYTYRYYIGRALARMPDTSFTYLLPAMPGSTLRTTSVTSLEERLGQKRTEEFHSAGFRYKIGDTICASRAGTVYQTNNDAEEGEKHDQSFSQNRNRIAIEQRDGTLSIYSILAPIKLLVSQGETVSPGQPLAVFDKESEKYEMFMAVSYLDERRLTSNYMNPDHPDKPAYYIALPIHFFTGDNGQALQVHSTYIVTHPREVVAAELTRKEKKKFGL